MNYQLARPTEFRANRIIWIGSTRWYYASKIRVEVLVPFHLKDLAKVFESDHELDWKVFRFGLFQKKSKQEDWGYGISRGIKGIVCGISRG